MWTSIRGDVYSVIEISVDGDGKETPEEVAEEFAKVQNKMQELIDRRAKQEGK